MNQEEHVSMARELMGRADKESGDGGNEMIAAEFLWGAFAHCLNTVALNQGLSHDSHGAFGRISQRLNQSQGGMCICRVLGIGAGVSRECFGL